MTKQERKDRAIQVLIHAMSYIRRELEMSPSNAVALRIIEFNLDTLSR